MWTDVRGCFAPGEASLVSHETLWKHGKDLPVSQKQETFIVVPAGELTFERI